jgi:hypothetical protein
MPMKMATMLIVLPLLDRVMALTINATTANGILIQLNQPRKGMNPTIISIKAIMPNSAPNIFMDNACL